MEKVYNPSDFCATEKIHLHEYFSKFSQELLNVQKANTFDPKNDLYETLKAEIDEKLTDKQKECLETTCSISHLDVPGEGVIITTNRDPLDSLASRLKPSEIPDAAMTLKCAQILKQKGTDSYTDATYLSSRLETRTYPEDKGLNDLKVGEEILINVRMFQPWQYKYGHANVANMKWDYEVVLLGSNTLADFRDIISCSSDIAVCEDLSEKLDTTIVAAKDLYPSAFIFINDHFYIDLRAENAIDYSAEIREWAVKKKLGDFKYSRMESKQLRDLTLRFGYPYVFQHQGGCEHIFMFSFARLLNSEDSLSSTIYPFISHVARNQMTPCTMCGISMACWLVVSSDRLPRERAPVCAECFKSYNYIDDKKVGSFKAYPFFNRAFAL